MSTQYQFIEIAKNGPAEVLAVQEGSFDDTLAPEEVLIEVAYSGINFADIMMRLGLYRDAPPKPFIPGYEVSGTIKAVGSAVTQHQVGDQVMAGTKFGGYVNQIKLPEWQVLEIPNGLDLQEAAALPVSYITAYIAFNEFGRIRKGDKVLIDCATGGLGVVFLQMCQAVGAQAHGLTSTPSKKSLIESFGAKAYLINEFDQSDAQGFDFILNSSGGKSLKDQYHRLAKSGKLCGIGLQSAISNGKGSKWSQLKAALSSPWFPFLKLVIESKSVSGFNALKYFDDEPWMKKHLPNMQSTMIKPKIGAVFPAAEVAKAHQTLEQKQATGKVLLAW
jgi:NADPH:quinone reductase-like Zn-dependent oxidoreductase